MKTQEQSQRRQNGEVLFLCDENDPFTFIIVAVEQEREFGFSTYVYSNKKQPSVVLKKYSVIGHCTRNPIAGFNVGIQERYC